eukprot:1902799-Rhodomonas_salina.2
MVRVQIQEVVVVVAAAVVVVAPRRSPGSVVLLGEGSWREEPSGARRATRRNQLHFSPVVLA